MGEIIDDAMETLRGEKKVVAHGGCIHPTDYHAASLLKLYQILDCVAVLLCQLLCNHPYNDSLVEVRYYINGGFL